MDKIKNVKGVLQKLDKLKTVDFYNKDEEFSKQLSDEDNHKINLDCNNNLFAGNKMFKGQTIRFYERILDENGDKKLIETDFNNGPYVIISGVANGKYFDIVIEKQEIIRWQVIE